MQLVKPKRILHLLPYLIAISTLLITLIFRFSWLDLMPSGLNWDEAAYGYNAFSLLETGRDEWNVKWPLFLKSFGDYKPALLSYLQIPVIYLNGLTIISLRLPVAILGVTSQISWFFIQEKMHFFKSGKYAKLLSIIGVILLAASPWHIHYSRAAMDPIVSFSFLLMGYALFIQNGDKKRWVGVISLLLSMYSYNSARIFVPILLVLHLIIFERSVLINFKQNLQRIFQATTVLLGFMLILLFTLISEVGARAQSVFILNKPQIQDQTNESIYRSTVLGMRGLRLYSNKAITGTYTLTKNYLSHFDPLFLYFDRNLSSRHGFSKHGNLLLITLPFLIWGLFSANKNSKQDKFFLLWLLLSPIPSALSDDVPHSGRTLIMLPALIYFIMSGIQKLFFETGKLKKVTISLELLMPLLIVGAVFINTSLYLIDMYRYFPEESYLDWQGDARTTAEAINGLGSKEYKSVTISKELMESYIFYAFYSQLDPQILQQYHFSEDQESLANVVFAETSLCSLARPNSLIVSTEDFSTQLTNDLKLVDSSIYITRIYKFDRFVDNKPIGYIYNREHLTSHLQASLDDRCN